MENDLLFRHFMEKDLVVSDTIRIFAAVSHLEKKRQD